LSSFVKNEAEKLTPSDQIEKWPYERVRLKELDIFYSSKIKLTISKMSHNLSLAFEIELIISKMSHNLSLARPFSTKVLLAQQED